MLVVVGVGPIDFVMAYCFKIGLKLEILQEKRKGITLVDGKKFIREAVFRNCCRVIRKQGRLK